MMVKCPFCQNFVPPSQVCCHVMADAFIYWNYCPDCAEKSRLHCPFCGYSTPWNTVEMQRDIAMGEHYRSCAGYAAAMLVGDQSLVKLVKWRPKRD